MSSPPPTPAKTGGVGGVGGWAALPEVVGELARLGYHLDLDRSMATPVLAPPPPDLPVDAARRVDDLIVEHRIALTWIALGRYTGHALAVCDECGFASMLAVLGHVVGPRGGQPTLPRCLLAPSCSGRRVIRGVDAEGVRRVRHPTAPVVRVNKRARQRRAGQPESAGATDLDENSSET